MGLRPRLAHLPTSLQDVGQPRHPGTLAIVSKWNCPANGLRAAGKGASCKIERASKASFDFVWDRLAGRAVPSEFGAARAGLIAEDLFSSAAADHKRLPGQLRNLIERCPEKDAVRS